MMCDELSSLVAELLHRVLEGARVLVELHY
jgi:hypothetical protein